MSDESLTEKVRRVFEEGWNKGNLAVFDETYTANVVTHDPGNPTKDREDVKRSCLRARTRWPDLHITIDDLLAAEGNKVVIRYTAEATETQGVLVHAVPPTGKHIKVTHIAILLFQDGQVTQQWYEWDALGLQKQLQGQP